MIRLNLFRSQVIWVFEDTLWQFQDLTLGRSKIHFLMQCAGRANSSFLRTTHSNFLCSRPMDAQFHFSSSSSHLTRSFEASSSVYRCRR
ncbi:hypothetical protein NPIL_15081 [Nephila pilipes]|uniref:Uncharacterized protein n=1 Tax=Nephila pilipes TaxID=299642 RepID=A0A8X6P463_NEPPI|nr:hypothetical protein NPIL_15081 [Nephila pilipes]